MQSFCAKCGRASDGQLLCPHCGIRFVDESATATTLTYSSADGSLEPADAPSFVRRLTLGGITLLGVFHGLKHLATAAAIKFCDADNPSIDALLGLLLAATLAASVVAGTVNRRAELTGFLLGFGAALVFVGLDIASGSNPPVDWLIGVPIVLALVGSVGGLAGRMMIPPTPKMPTFRIVDSHFDAPPKVPTPPLVWWRLGLGAIVVIAGTEYSDAMRQGLSHALAGHSGAYGSMKFLTWQVSVIFGLVGGVVAGCNTKGGLRQGLYAGIAAAAVALMLESRRGDSESVLIQFWFDQIGSNITGPAIAALGTSVLIATTVGGWLGAHLLPPRGTN